MRRYLFTAIVVFTAVVDASAQTADRDPLARGRSLWSQRLATSAIAALEAATRDRSTAAEAHEQLGRIYTFKGWLEDNGFRGWQDEPSVRGKALAEMRAAVAADPNLESAKEALATAEGFARADSVDPAPPRSEIKTLETAIDAARNAPVPELEKAIDARVRAQADPQPYFTGAQVLIDRAEYDKALAIAGGPAPIRQRATQALTALRSAESIRTSEPFDAWLDAELTRRRDERRQSSLESVVDKPLPRLALTTVDGKPYDTKSLQGKVLLLNFFASW